MAHMIAPHAGVGLPGRGTGTGSPGTIVYPRGYRRLPEQGRVDCSLVISGFWVGNGFVIVGVRGVVASGARASAQTRDDTHTQSGCAFGCMRPIGEIAAFGSFRERILVVQPH
ncbi:hypothetical protein GCM10018952_17450 [Streptosporangium vulgare]